MIIFKVRIIVVFVMCLKLIEISLLFPKLRQMFQCYFCQFDRAQNCHCCDERKADKIY